MTSSSSGTDVPNREALREKIAEALWLRKQPRLPWAGVHPQSQSNCRADADAVLAVVSEEIGYNAADRTWRADADTQQHIADLVAERDEALWLHAEAVWEQGTTQETLGRLLKASGDKYLKLVEAMRKAGHDIHDLKRERDTAREELAQAQARIDAALALCEPHQLRHSFTSRQFHAALTKDHAPASPSESEGGDR